MRLSRKTCSAGKGKIMGKLEKPYDKRAPTGFVSTDP
jgi:hypothetical protein